MYICNNDVIYRIIISGIINYRKHLFTIPELSFAPVPIFRIIAAAQIGTSRCTFVVAQSYSQHKTTNDLEPNA